MNSKADYVMRGAVKTPTPAEVLKREQAKAKREALEMAMLQQIRAVGLEHALNRQFIFHPRRKWAFDFAFQHERVALEVDGGTFKGGRHTTGLGFEADCEKLNEAAVLGWKVLRVTARHIKSGAAIGWVQMLVGQA